MVGRLGVSGGYGAPTEAFEMAFERGCNYFYHGSMRKQGMNQAIKNLVARGKRDELVILVQIYTRAAWHFRMSFHSFLKKTGLDRVEVLLLGWYGREPRGRILEACARLKEKGLIQCVALSGHNRRLFPRLAENDRYDIFHVRYNAAHRGAETEVFDKLPADDRPGLVTYTATRWGHLINPKRMPPNVPVPRASDCYRFVLTHPSVDVCMTGPRNLEQMKEALAALDRGPLSQEEIEWMRQIGDHIHRKSLFG